MTETTADQYVELALDLPERKRAVLLDRLDREDPELARSVRTLLTTAVRNSDFACQAKPTGTRVSDTRLDRMHHAAITVGEIGRAVTWYRARFGCDIEYADASWALLRFDNFRLALVLPEQHPPHVAMLRADAAGFGELTEHRDGSKSVYIADPWGNSIEILDSATVASDGPQSSSRETSR